MPRRTHAEMNAETTGRLLAVARQQFATVGYRDAALETVCAEAGVTRGALYHHFGSKQGLFEAVVNVEAKALNARIEQECARCTGPWEILETACRAFLDAALDPAVQRILFRDAPAVFGQGPEEIEATYAVNPLADRLAEALGPASAAPADPLALAHLLYGALMECAMWIATGDDAAARHEAALGGIAFLLDGLKRAASR